VNRYRMLAAIGALSLLGAACGSDDDDSTATTGPVATTSAAASTSAPAAGSTTTADTQDTASDTTDSDTTGSDTTDSDTTDSDTTDSDTTDHSSDTTDAMSSGSTVAGTPGSTVGGEFAELCTLAEELDAQQSPPTAAQLTQYQELAPEEIKEDVDTLAEALIPVEDDMVAFFNVIAEDDNEEHAAAIDAFEEENCGIAHSEQNELPPGVVQDVEDDAARVDVTGLDYEFRFDAPTEPGRTSFVLTNDGEEAHFLLVVKLAEGVAMQDALESETGEGVEGQWETKVAAAGGDEEAVTFDLEPGNYGVVCFIPAADGTPHAFLGMSGEFTIAG
jgi:hypothetical protein